MSRAFNKEFRRSITHSMGRFLAIAVISALGCGFYAGLRMTPIDMNLSADMFYDATNMSDLYVIGTLGFEDEDIQELRAIEGVRGIEAARTKDEYAMLGDIKYVVRFNGLDMQSALSSDCSDEKGAVSDNASYINRPVLVEGAWPTEPGQCVVAADAVLDVAPKIGDTLRLVRDADDETLSFDEYTICGFVRSPFYPMTSNFASSELGSGEIDTYAYVPNEVFSQDMPYTAAYITEEYAGLVIPSHFVVVRVDITKALPQYIAWYLNKDRIKKAFRMSCTGMLKQIKPTMVGETEIKLPSLERQRQVVELYNISRQEIVLLERQIRQKEAYYKALINKVNRM